MAKLRYIAASLALDSSLVQAQGLCNPLKTSCPPLPGFTQGLTNDFTERPNIPSDWIVADYADHLLSFGENGLEFRLTKGTDAPYIWTKNYLHYGKVEVTLQSAPGIGVVSSAVLMSDTHDEIDWEWSGNDFAYKVPTIQTNYFGKGVTGNWDRGTQPQVAKNMSQNFLTYTIDWKPESITWSIDGSVIRTHYAKDCDNDQYQYPQSPSRFHLGVWDAGNEGNAWYTVQWAGGHTDLTKFPYSMFVKNVSITPYTFCGQYNFTDTSGSSNSVACLKDTHSLNSTLPGSGTGTGTYPTKTSGPSHTCSAAAPENTQPGTSSGCAKYYTVKSGDSCDSIAKAAGIDVDNLLDWNPQADDKCWNLWANYAICVSPPGQCDASGKPVPQTTADCSSLTTATIKYTSTITVLKCASTITNCPAASKTVPVVSTTVMQFTTVCPVSEVESISSVAAGGVLPVGATPLPGGDVPSYATPTAIPAEDADEIPGLPPAYEDDESVPPPGPTTKVITTVYTTVCPEESTITTHGSVVTSTGSKLTTSTITSTITKTLPIESAGSTLPPGYTTSDVTTVYTTICPVESTITTQGTTSISTGTKLTTSTRTETYQTTYPIDSVSTRPSDVSTPPPGYATSDITTVYTTICPIESTIITRGTTSTSTGTQLTTSTISTTYQTTLPVEEFSTPPPGYTTSDVTTVYTTTCSIESTIVTSGTTSTSTGTKLTTSTPTEVTQTTVPCTTSSSSSPITSSSSVPYYNTTSSSFSTFSQPNRTHPITTPPLNTEESTTELSSSSSVITTPPTYGDSTTESSSPSSTKPSSSTSEVPSTTPESSSSTSHSTTSPSSYEESTTQPSTTEPPTTSPEPPPPPPYEESSTSSSTSPTTPPTEVASSTTSSPGSSSTSVSKTTPPVYEESTTKSSSSSSILPPPPPTTSSSSSQSSTSPSKTLPTASTATTCIPPTTEIACPQCNGAAYSCGNGKSYEITCDADYVGGDLKYIDCGADKNPKEACAKECAKTAGCKGFSVVGYHCYLKKTLYALKKYGGCVAGKLVEGPVCSETPITKVETPSSSTTEASSTKSTTPVSSSSSLPPSTTTGKSSSSTSSTKVETPSTKPSETKSTTPIPPSYTPPSSTSLISSSSSSKPSETKSTTSIPPSYEPLPSTTSVSSSSSTPITKAGTPSSSTQVPSSYVPPTTTQPSSSSGKSSTKTSSTTSSTSLVPANCPTAGCFTYVDCYIEIPGRALKGKSFDNQNLTTQACADFCHGYKYFATEYSTECYCGNELPTQCTKATDGRCNMPCAADKSQICGGPEGLSLYENTLCSPPVSSSSVVSSPSSTSSKVPSSSSSSSSKVSSSSSQSSTSSTAPTSPPAYTPPPSSSSSVSSSSSSWKALSSSSSSQSSRSSTKPSSPPAYTPTTSSSSSSIVSSSSTSVSKASVPSSSSTQTSPPAYTPPSSIPSSSSSSSKPSSSSLVSSTTPTSPPAYTPPPSSTTSSRSSSTSKTSTGPTPVPTADGYSYLGCYLCPKTHDIIPTYHATTDLTVEKCAALAKGSGHSIFGIKDGWQCWTGNTLDAAAEKTGQDMCYVGCKGNLGQCCGSPDAFSVYEIGGQYKPRVIMGRMFNGLFT